jgi:hypothetical protein
MKAREILHAAKFNKFVIRIGGLLFIILEYVSMD